MSQIPDQELPDIEQLAYQVVTRLQGDLSPSNPRQAYVSVALDELTKHRDLQVAHLRALAKHWEATMGEDDKTLYSLGLRHAVDVLLGIDPADIKHTSS